MDFQQLMKLNLRISTFHLCYHAILWINLIDLQVQNNLISKNRSMIYRLYNNTAAGRIRRRHGLKISQSIVHTRFLWRVVSYFFRFRWFWPVFRLPRFRLMKNRLNILKYIQMGSKPVHWGNRVCWFRWRQNGNRQITGKLRKIGFSIYLEI